MPVVIVQRFAARREALAAKKMSEYLKRRISPEDVVQSVFADYFRRVADNQIETRDWDSVWGLLARMTVWEICRQSAHYQAVRRTLDREVPLEEGEGIGREPQAEDLAMASDLYEQLLKGIPEKYRPIWRQS